VVLLLVALGGCVLPGCDTTCIPTATDAHDATRLDLVAPAGSAVLRGSLAADGTELPGRQLVFDVLATGGTVHSGTASTGADGTASLDLKRVDAGAVGALVRGDQLRVTFGGDGTYCASADDAAFDVVRAPAGVPVS
jgi:L-ascorbate metabolism protein UlaG (beta-lactamase superfamily)